MAKLTLDPNYQAKNSGEKKESALDRLNRKYGIAMNMDQAYLDDFNERWNQYANSAEKDYNSMRPSNAGSVLRSRAEAAADLQRRNAEINRWLNYNRSTLGEKTFNEHKQMLSNMNEATTQSMDAFRGAKEYFAQWDTDEDYDDFLDYNEKLNFDVDAGRQELEELKQKRDGMTAENRPVESKPQASTYLTGGSNTAATPYAAGLQGDTSFNQELADMNALIEQKEEYLRDAERIQQSHSAQIAAQEENEELLNLDIEAAEKELEALEQRRDELARQNIPAQNNYLTGGSDVASTPYAAGLQNGAAGDKELSDINSQISQGKQRINRAKYLQEWAALGSVAENEDFAEFSVRDDKNGDIVYSYINGADNGVREEMIGSQNHNHYLTGDVQDTSSPYAAGLQARPENTPVGRLRIYDHMTEDEIAVYNYHYAKDGKEAAERYLWSITERLNAREASKMFEGLEGNTGLELLFGVSAGFDQFASGLSNLFNTEDEYIPVSAYQIASGMVREDLADAGPRLPDWAGGMALSQIGYDLVTTTANMAPSVLTSVALSMVNPVAGSAWATAGQIAGTGLMGASAAGNAYQEALNLGYDKGQARLYSTLVGASEAGLEYLLGGVSALGGKLSNKTLTKILDGVDNAFARTAIKLGGNMLSEGFEEGLQEILTPYFKNLAFHTDEDVNWGEVAYSALLGALTAGVMEGGGTISGEVNTYRTGRQLQKADISAQRLADLGKTFSADTVAYQLAGRVNENTGAYTMGRLFNEIGATMTEQNVNEITNALVAEGMDEKTARKNAEAMAYIVEGGSLTDAQAQIIEANDILAEAMRTTFIDRNATWFQRSQGYNKMLMKLAQQKTVPKASQTNPAKQSEVNAPVADKVDTQNENGAEAAPAASGGFEVSADGQTKLKSSGEAVSIQSIESIEDGKMMLQVGDQVVDARDVSYGSKEDALVYEMVADLGISAAGANALFESYKLAKIPAATFVHGIRDAYQYGAQGYSMSELATGTFTSKLTKAQREDAYNLGKESTGNTKSDSSKGSKKTTTPRRRGRVKGYGVTTKDISEAFNINRSNAYKLLATLADVTGIDIVLFKSTADKDGNLRGGIVEGIDMSNSQGAFSWHNDKIYIDINAGLKTQAEASDIAKYSMLRTFAHEFTHFIEKHNPVEYENFRELVFEEMRRNETDPEDLIDAYMAQHPNIDHDGASREVVAEAMTDILPQSSFVKQLAQKQPGFFQELLGKLKDFVKRIKDYFSNIGSNTAVEVAAVKREIDGAIKYSDEIVDMFDRIAVQAVEHYQSGTTAQKNTAPEDGGKVQYQAKSKGNIKRGIEKGGKITYNKNTKVFFGENVFPPYNVSQSEAHELAERWSRNEHTEVGDRKLISFHNRWYVIQSFDNMKYGYQIMKKLTKAEYKREALYYGTVTGYQSLQDSLGEDAAQHYRRSSDGNAGYRLDNDPSEHRGENRTVHGLGENEVQRGEIESNGGGNMPRSGSDSQRGNESSVVLNNDAHHQHRTSTLTNRDVLEHAAQMEDKQSLTQAQRNALEIYSKNLGELRQFERQRSEKQAELSKKEKGGAPNRELVGLKNQIKIFDQRIARVADKLTEYEKVDNLKTVVEQVKPVIVEQRLTEWKEKYGTIHAGEKAVRSDALPVSTDGKNKVSRTARTVKGAAVTPDEFADLIDAEVAGNGLTYIPITNSETVRKATERIMEQGWEAARHQWTANVRAGKTGADMVATGALLLNNAAKAGDRETWLDILHDYQIMSTYTAQGLQALHILKQLQPDDELYMIRRSIKQMVEDMHLDTEITLDQELAKKYQKAETDEERDEIFKQIAKSVASQIPATWMEKWTALRYVNMLGNLRTQVRNITGNLGMKAVVSFKNSVAASLEHIAHTLSGGKLERTKSMVVSRDAMKAAKEDFELVKSVVLDGGKYSDAAMASTAFAKAVQENRRIFKFKPLEGYRKVTNWAMENGDLVFSKSAYARALAGYLKAHGVKGGDYSKVDIALMDEARLFAVKEAQEATFRDTNWLSGWISKVGRRRDTPAIGKVLSEGIMPFRKTPANVLIRAEEYSPLGIINSIVTSIQAMRKDSEITGAQVINSWAKSLTGTGLFGLGMLLHSLGMLVGGADEDDDLDRFESLNGWQNYALVLPGGTNLTIDFLSPAAMPMFMGAQVMKLANEDGIELKEIVNALISISDPMIQMSMLQGVNDTLENIQYSKDKLGQFLINAAVSYLTQGLTNTLMGQLERSFEGQRMTTFVDKDSALPDWMQRTLGKASAKIPGWDYNQIPYINAWGQEEQNPTVPLNTVYNMLSPSYVDKGEEDEVSKELTRLNAAQSDINVFPSTPEKKYGDRYLSAEEYMALAKAQGQTQRQIIEDMVSSELYADLPDAYKAKAIEFAYGYARESAQIEVLDRDGFTSDWMTEISGNTAEGILKHVIAENIKGMYLDGYITADEAIKRRMEYRGDSAAAAAEKVAYWDFQTENPQYSDWSEDTVSKYKDLAPDKAAHVVEVLGGLSAEAGYTNVRPIQKFEAIAGDATLTSSDKDAALRAVMDDNLETKYDTALGMGIGMDDFVRAYRKYQDTSGTGKKSTVVDYYKKTFGISTSKAEELYDIFAGKKKE